MLDIEVDYSLGYEVLATDRRVVVRVQLGPGIDGNRVYPPLERSTYLAIQLANTNSGPAWTEPDRQACRGGGSRESVGGGLTADLRAKDRITGGALAKPAGGHRGR